ncbi:AraC family transcriptional regulator [Amnibacterium kyonggiense]|uniref:AraC-like DNA-binding protein n=1 Tax=Amnibacterium kyonggiense TaxID=595671 RepID=A0A4R7FIM6_9MICO|nr:AraC family transcriptional regulator [Amnibacterium kyonggiense]TDS76101.1 AraC-like DNA-binding protein [Amnibacterium kyonggiense]
MLVRDGFPGQRFRVLPRPLVESALREPVTRRLLVTDAGYFPHAAAHGRVRPLGAPESIVMVCTAGSGVVTVAGVAHRASAGDAIVLPSGTRHSYVADVLDPWSIWWMHVAGADSRELVEAIGVASAPVLRLREPASAAAAIEGVVAVLERDETIPTLYAAAGSAWTMLANLAAERRRGPGSDGDRIRAVQDHIRSNLTAPHTVGALARRVGLSASHFSAVFRRATGVPVMEYVKRLRSARARELLMTTDLTVAEIAERVGYADAFYFSRQFHAVNGTSPRAFRARGRLDEAVGSESTASE